MQSPYSFKHKFEKIYFIGDQDKAFKQGLEKANYAGFQSVEKSFNENTAKEFGADLKKSDVILVKGSRGMKLERFVEYCEPLDFQLKK